MSHWANQLKEASLRYALKPLPLQPAGSVFHRIEFVFVEEMYFT
jgi:hypothetical protein